jgi:hypothetical protein
MLVAFKEVTVETPEELILPVTLPVKFPTKPLVAVMIPDATTLVKEIFGSRLTVTVLLAADEVKLVPPEIVKDSVKRSIFSEPESPVTVKPEPTAAVVTAVTNPLALTVTTGIKVCEPKDPTLELTVANVVAVFTEVISPVKLGILVVEVAVPVTLPTKPEVAVMIPEALMLVAFSEVTVETPEELILPVRFPVTLPVKFPTKPEVEVVTPDALMLVAFSEVTVETPEELILPVTLPVKFPTKPEVEVVTPEALILVALSEVTVETPEELILPVTLPVKFPTKPEVAVMIPDATTLVKEIFGSRLTVTVFDAADEVKLVPPEIVKDSLRRSIFSEPESPVTVSAVPTAAVVTAVTSPLALTVTTGIKVCEPKDPTLELTVANVVVVFTELISPVKLGILVVVVAVPVKFPVTLPEKPLVAVTIPDALMFVAFSEVTVETPEELILPVRFPVTFPVTFPTKPLEEVVTPVTTTPDALVSNEGELTSPVKFPVTLPEKPLVAVTTPDATTLVKEMFGSRLTVTVLDAADEVKLVPPEIVNTSLRRLMFSEPESPATVSAVPTDAVPAAVNLPLESTVNVATSVEDP